MHRDSLKWGRDDSVITLYCFQFLAYTPFRYSYPSFWSECLKTLVIPFGRKLKYCSYRGSPADEGSVKGSVGMSSCGVGWLLWGTHKGFRQRLLDTVVQFYLKNLPAGHDGTSNILIQFVFRYTFLGVVHDEGFVG